MKKLFKLISDWWNYTILKKNRNDFKEHHDNGLEKNRNEIVNTYGQGINKKKVPYYYKDTFQVSYNGDKVLNKIRIARVFVNKQEFDDHSEN